MKFFALLMFLSAPVFAGDVISLHGAREAGAAANPAQSIEDEIQALKTTSVASNEFSYMAFAKWPPKGFQTFRAYLESGFPRWSQRAKNIFGEEHAAIREAYIRLYATIVGLDADVDRLLVPAEAEIFPQGTKNVQLQLSGTNVSVLQYAGLQTFMVLNAKIAFERAEVLDKGVRALLAQLNRQMRFRIRFAPDLNNNTFIHDEFWLVMFWGWMLNHELDEGTPLEKSLSLPWFRKATESFAHIVRTMQPRNSNFVIGSTTVLEGERILRARSAITMAFNALPKLFPNPNVQAQFGEAAAPTLKVFSPIAQSCLKILGHM